MLSPNTLNLLSTGRSARLDLETGSSASILSSSKAVIASDISSAIPTTHSTGSGSTSSVLSASGHLGTVKSATKKRRSRPIFYDSEDDTPITQFEHSHTSIGKRSEKDTPAALMTTSEKDDSNLTLAEKTHDNSKEPDLFSSPAPISHFRTRSLQSKQTSSLTTTSVTKNQVASGSRLSTSRSLGVISIGSSPQATNNSPRKRKQRDEEASTETPNVKRTKITASEKHGEYWLENDDFVILELAETQYKLQKNRLAKQSTYFSKIFQDKTLAHHSVGGYPTYDLRDTGVAVRDLEALLYAMDNALYVCLIFL